MFDELTQETFDEREKRVLDFWNREKIFEKSLEQRAKRLPFTFYDGPPFATGLPHYGHLLAGTIKDVVPRYKTMKGFYVSRRFGWDCHGLPIEQEIEKAQNLTGATSIEEFGIAKFNEDCRGIVLRYTEEWKTIVSRMGRWVDFNRTYKTMDLTFMESVWWVFNELFKKGLVYEGYKVMPYSAKLGTPLSNFEAGENYKEIDDPSLTVAFTLEKDPDTEILAWTTTPWTLISNLALMVHPDIQYVKILDTKSHKKYILSQERVPHYYKDPSEYTVLGHMKGSDLVGLKYKPILPYFMDRVQKGDFRIIPETTVSNEDGTGVVQTAPAFGEIDFYACQREGIGLVCPVDENGRFTPEIKEYAGLFVKDADKDIIRRLKSEGKVFHLGMLRHRYPFCWRSDTPLIYKAVTTWFVAVEKIKDRLIEANRQIQWTPSHIKFGRFGKWLEGARDWAISRNRYWGTPIPIWRSEDGDFKALGSIAELEKLTGAKIHDLHRHFIDDLSFSHQGKTYKRIPEVFDCWFESGSMPYAQNHYPFDNQTYFEDNFPADFIAEGLDQTRGWFYTLTILAAALFDKPAFKHVIVNGILLAADGTKMSKRLKNYPDPMEVVHRHGADAIRLYMLHSPAVKADDLWFKESGVELVQRQILIPLWNAYSFFITYARIYNWTPSKHLPHPENEIDRWMLSILNKLIKDVEEGMDAYDLSRAVEPLVGFIDQLTNWYIRRSRRRFWEDKETLDRHQAFATLYHVLLELSKVAAPFVPFIADAIYRNLRSDEMPVSVHLCDYPKYLQQQRNEEMEKGMAAVQNAVSLGHSLRKEHKIKVRQPLPAAQVASASSEILQYLRHQQHLIAEELNVKQVHFTANEDEFVTLKIKPNFRILGKKVGKLMKAAQTTIDKLPSRQQQKLADGHSVTIDLEGEKVEITPEDVLVERQVLEGVIAAHAENVTVGLDTQLNPDLLKEGLAREFVNKINTMRRDTGLAVSDRVKIVVESTSKVQDAYLGFKNYIDNEVLAVDVEFAPNSGIEWDLNGEMAKIEIHKV